MGLDLSKLENVRHHGSKVIARCPTCAETGNDRKGEHLFIEENGKFGCVVYSGHDGRKHRQRIFELAGIKTTAQTGFSVRCPSHIISEQVAVQKDILGRLGHINSTHARKTFDEPVITQENKNKPLNTVPSVPEDSLHLYAPNELEMLQGIDAESLERIDEVKRIFNGTVVSVIHRKP